MSLSSTTNRVSYVGINSGATYNFPYLFFNDADLIVNFYDTVAGSTYLQTLNTDYTVSGTKTNNVYQAGANVVINSALPTAWDVVITRSPSPVQNFVLGQNGIIPAIPLTQEFDYITLLIQREHDLNTRSVRLPDGVVATNFDPTLPIGIAFASNCFLVVNSAGTGWAFALNQGGFGPTGLPLVGNGSNAVSTYQALSLSGAGVTGTLPATAGGTGQTTWTPGLLTFASSASQLAGFPNGIAGQVLTQQSGGGVIWAAFSLGSGAVPSSSIVGILSPAQGGTGNSNFIQYGVIYGNSSALAQVGAGTAGQLLSFNSGAAPSWSSLSGSSYVGFWPLSQGGTSGSNVVVTASNFTGFWPLSLGGTSGSNVVVTGSNYAGTWPLSQGGTAGSNIVVSGSNYAGTWPISQGGLGLNVAPALFNLMMASSTTQISVVPYTGTAGQLLTYNSGTAPTWQSFSVAGQSGVTPIANGGTGVGAAITASSGLIPLWQGSNPMAALSPIAMENMLVNAGFDWWQALPSGSNVLMSQVTYLADQWYVANSGGVTLTVSRNTGQLPGSFNGHQLQVTTASGAQATYELWQTLDNQTTMGRFVGQSTISAGVLIKSLGFVNQMGVQLFSCSGEVKGMAFPIGGFSVQSSITSEQTFTVTSANWTSSGPLLFNPTYAAGSNGVVAMRIRATATNSGTFSVGSNGFIVEQAGLYGGIGNTNQWKRRMNVPFQELWDCMRFYEKSYEAANSPGTGVGVTNGIQQPLNQQNANAPLVARVPKRADATYTLYSTSSGASGKCWDAQTVTDQNAAISGAAQNTAIISFTGSASHYVQYHYVIDARM